MFRIPLPFPVFAVLFLVALHPVSAQEVPGADAAFRESYKTGKNYYGFCMFCHARNGKGTPLPNGSTMAPPLVASKRVLGSKEVVTRIVLHGLTGKVDGVVYEKDGVAMQPPPSLMVDDDEIVAGLLNYIRNTWGNKAPVSTASEGKLMRDKEAGRGKQWTLEELAKKFPGKRKGKGE